MGDSELSDRGPLAGVPAPRDGLVGTTLLIVSDQDRSREFYVNVLCASAIRERDPVVLRLGGMWLILNDGGGPTPDKPETIAAPPADRSRFSSALNLRVADVHSTWQRLQSAGAEFLTSPIDRGPEIRCYLHDPDGHLIEIGQTHTAS
jgi:lactoylglutathione lyase